MISYLKRRRKVAEFELRERELALQNHEANVRLQEAYLKYNEHMLELSNNIVLPDKDELRFLDIADDEGNLEEMTLLRTISKCKVLWMTNEFAKAIIENLVNYIAGRGFSISSKDENELVQENWDEFAKRHKWRKRSREIVRRSFRDGDCFIRFFTNEVDEEDGPAGTVKMRFLNPIRVTTPQGKETGNEGQEGKTIIKSGIEINKDDVEDVKGYWYQLDEVNWTRIPSNVIYHIKPLGDSDMVRGLPFLFNVMRRLKRYETYEKGRLLLALGRMVIAERKISGSPDQVVNFAHHSDRAFQKSDGTWREKAIRPGTYRNHNEGVEYDYHQPNLQSLDAKEDARQIRLGLSAGTQQSEVMVTTDASNANYASTMVAESPPVKSFESWQDEFSEIFSDIHIYVTEQAIRNGLLSAVSTKTEIVRDSLTGELNQSTPEEIPTVTDANVEMPDIAVHDVKKEVDANLAAMGVEIMSKRTAATRMGLNYEDELDELEWEMMRSIKKGREIERDNGTQRREDRLKDKDKEEDNEDEEEDNE